MYEKKHGSDGIGAASLHFNKASTGTKKRHLVVKEDRREHQPVSVQVRPHLQAFGLMPYKLSIQSRSERVPNLQRHCYLEVHFAVSDMLRGCGQCRIVCWLALLYSMIVQAAAAVARVLVSAVALRPNDAESKCSPGW